MSKKIKPHSLKDLYFEGGIDDVIQELKDYKEQYKDYDNLRVVEDFEYGGGYYHKLYGDKLETDSEYKARIESQRIRDRTNLEQERKQYERLKAKFETNQ